jgi:hypothetical protein
MAAFLSVTIGVDSIVNHRTILASAPPDLPSFDNYCCKPYTDHRRQNPSPNPTCNLHNWFSPNAGRTVAKHW